MGNMCARGAVARFALFLPVVLLPVTVTVASETPAVAPGPFVELLLLFSVWPEAWPITIV